ncbi:MAG: hypothetical protein EA411_11360 [Saprospirales bacterium]|nr:MAG: hypothetical protein EA411_11360 [Saprospirales bacterium]
MKYLILPLAFAFFLGTGHLAAQFTFKPYIGINSAELSDDFDDEEFRSGLGYQIGADLMIGRRLYIQPGLNFEFAQIEVRGVEDISDMELSRINMPVMLGFKMFQEDVDKFFDIRVFTGPNASFLANYSGGDGLEISSSEIRNFNLSWNAGVGVDLFMFFIDLGYKWGVNDFFGRDVDSDATINVFYGNAGLRFTF